MKSNLFGIWSLCRGYLHKCCAPQSHKKKKKMGAWWVASGKWFFFFIRSCAQLFNLDDWIYIRHSSVSILICYSKYNFEYLLYFGWHDEIKPMYAESDDGQQSRCVFFAKHTFIYTSYMLPRLSELVIYYTFEQFKMSHMCGTQYRVAFVGAKLADI